MTPQRPHSSLLLHLVPGMILAVTSPIISSAASFPISMAAVEPSAAYHSTATETIELTGLVSDEAGKPIRAAMVRTYKDGNTGKYTLTDTKGRFHIIIDPSVPLPTSLQISKLGFETESVILTDPNKPLTVTLSKSAKTLKEVTVSAPEVRLRGDTVSYLLSAFVSQADLTLKDALKKLPGIEVDKSGMISYNGKDISKFYIEGMDLLGGKYDVATTNIPASYVNAVEVISNHQEKKIDRGIFTDNVAINVRLKRDAMFRPTGTYTLGTGLGKPFPWEASGAGMLFRNDFQSILTLKGTDIEEFSEREQRAFYAVQSDRLHNPAQDALPSLSAASPPLSRVRWIEPIDAAASLNFINKLKEETTCRTNVDYAYRQTRYDFSDSRAYFDGLEDMVITQSSNPFTTLHKTSVSNEYLVNADSHYQRNDFKGEASFITNDLPITTPASTVSQHQKIATFNLRDNFGNSWKRGIWQYYLGLDLEYLGSPKDVISISENSGFSVTSDPSHSMHRQPMLVSQRASSRSFSGGVSFSPSASISNSILSCQLKLNYTDELLSTRLTAPDTGLTPEGTTPPESPVGAFSGSQNRLSGQTVNLRIRPSWHLQTPYDRFILNVICPLELKRIDYNNTGSSPVTSSGLRFLTAPQTFMTLNLSSKSTFVLGADYARRLGDLLDFMTAPVMTDYLSATFRSGILSKEDSFRVSLQYDFKLPVSMWFLNTGITYLNNRRNLENEQDVGDGLIVTGRVPRSNSSDEVLLSVALTKNIRTINTKISLRGRHNLTNASVTQNEMPVRYSGTTSAIDLTLSSKPLKWLELFYDGSFSNISSSYLDRSRSYSDFTHNASVSFFPTEAWQLKFSADITDREMEPGYRKFSNLFDVYAIYKYRKFRFSLRLRNLLDCRSYSYTLFSGLDRFSYDYSLRGRQLIAKVSFTL